MIVWLNVDGSIGEVVSSYVLIDGNGEEVSKSFVAREGNNAGANEIYAYIEGGLPSGPDSLPYLTYAYPNGDTYGPQEATDKVSLAIQLDKNRDLKKFKAEKIYEFYKFVFPNGLIATGGNGLWKCAFTDTTGDGETYAYGPLLFRVEKNAVARETAITKSEYANLLSLLEGKLDKLINDSYVKASVGDGKYLVKEEGHGTQEVLNPSAFMSGFEAHAKKDGSPRLVVDSANTLLSNEAGDAKINAGPSGVVASGNFRVMPEGNTPAFQSTGDGTMMSDPTGAHRMTATGTSLKAVGGMKSDTEPAEDDDVATKAYVDQAVATGGDLKLNVENGAGEGSIKSRNAAEASGSGSIAFGHGAEAKGVNAVAMGYQAVAKETGGVAIGTGAETSPIYGVAIGYNVANSGQSGSVVMGKYYTLKDPDAVFVVGWLDATLFSLGMSGNSFLKPTTFKSDVTILGNLTAHKFTAVESENVTTESFSIGLGKGNTSPVESLMGLYCEKYDGENYGCLAWDKTGTAYVGDCQVTKEGVISDPPKALQPILTRELDSHMEDGALLMWDGEAKKAVTGAIKTSDGKTSIPGPIDLGGAVSVENGRASVGTPTSDDEIANKKYVDDNLSPVVIRRW